MPQPRVAFRQPDHSRKLLLLGALLLGALLLALEACASGKSSGAPPSGSSQLTNLDAGMITFRFDGMTFKFRYDSSSSRKKVDARAGEGNGGDDSRDTPATKSCGAVAESCDDAEGTFCSTTCGGPYKGKGARAWPVDTDASGAEEDGVPRCLDHKGNSYPATGVGAAPWLGGTDWPSTWATCGTYKEFAVDEGCRLAIVAYTDCCEDCVFKTIDYEVQEQNGDEWETKLKVSGPDEPECPSRVDVYTPTTDRVRIKALAPFYLCVAQE